jgi:CheY-like chemotaxis protein
MVPPTPGGEVGRVPWALADDLPIVVWEARADGSVDRYNRRWWEGATGATASCAWTERVHPSDRARCAAEWQRCVSSGDAFIADYRFRDAGGAYRWHTGRAEPVRGDDGEVRGWYGTSTEVHALAEARDALADADRRIGKRLVKLGHELRSPINAMVTAVELLDESPEPDLARRARDVLRRQLSQLDGLVDAVLRVSRDAGSRVELPAVRDHEAVLEEGAADPSADDEAAGKILVVDDNEDAAQGLSIILKRWGFDVQTAYDGETALTLADSFRPSKVLLDIGLPRMSGWDVARQLRRNPHTRGAMLIALTGYGTPEDRRRSQESGFDHHLVKPADAGELRRLLVG